MPLVSIPAMHRELIIRWFKPVMTQKKMTSGVCLVINSLLIFFKKVYLLLT